MDDNLSSIQKLEEISKGTVKPITTDVLNEDKKIIVEGTKISNKFLKILISKLEEQNCDPKVVIKLLSDLDEGVEKGEIDENSFNRIIGKGGQK